MKKTVLLLIVLFLVSLSACAQEPSESQAKAAAEKKLLALFPNRAKICLFTKTNDMDDERTHRIEYVAIAEITNNGSSVTELRDGVYLHKALPKFKWIKLQNPRELEQKHVVKGDIFRYAGTVIFDKTDKCFLSEE